MCTISVLNDVSTTMPLSITPPYPSKRTRVPLGGRRVVIADGLDWLGGDANDGDLVWFQGSCTGDHGVKFVSCGDVNRGSRRLRLLRLRLSCVREHTSDVALDI